MYTVGERVTVVIMKIEGKKSNRQDIPKCLSCDPVTKRFCAGVLGENNRSNPAVRKIRRILDQQSFLLNVPLPCCYNVFRISPHSPHFPIKIKKQRAYILIC